MNGNERNLEAVDDYIISIANSASDGAILHTFRGTESEVKAVIRGLLLEDAKNDTRIIEYSFDNTSAYLEYGDYHIYYTAHKISEITSVSVNERCLAQAKLCGDSDYGYKNDMYMMLRTIQEIEDDHNWQ